LRDDKDDIAARRRPGGIGLAFHRVNKIRKIKNQAFVISDSYMLKKLYFRLINNSL
jgi:hypothetical protein